MIAIILARSDGLSSWHITVDEIHKRTATKSKHLRLVVANLVVMATLCANQLMEKQACREQRGRAARDAGVSGTVEVRVVFDEAGKVIWVKAMSGPQTCIRLQRMPRGRPNFVQRSFQEKLSEHQAFCSAATHRFLLFDDLVAFFLVALVAFLLAAWRFSPKSATGSASAGSFTPVSKKSTPS